MQQGINLAVHQLCFFRVFPSPAFSYFSYTVLAPCPESLKKAPRRVSLKFARFALHFKAGKRRQLQYYSTQGNASIYMCFDTAYRTAKLVLDFVQTTGDVAFCKHRVRRQIQEHVQFRRRGALYRPRFLPYCDRNDREAPRHPIDKTRKSIKIPSLHSRKDSKVETLGGHAHYVALR